MANFLDKVSIRDFVVGGATLIGSTGAFWAGYSAVMTQVDSRIAEIADERAEALVEELEDALPGIIHQAARAYHDTDMRRRDIRLQLQAQTVALGKATDEDVKEALRSSILALEAELEELG